MKRLVWRVVETQLGEPGEDGRRRPEAIEGSETTIEADAIIIGVLGSSPVQRVGLATSTCH